jgi:peptidoglycan hydrolase-like protein with peptidoglycan-binding domain
VTAIQETAPPVPDEAATSTRRRPRRRWGRTVVAAGAAVAAAGAATAAALGVFDGGGGAAPAASNLPPATAEVTRTTLVATEDFDGTLGYGDTAAVLAAGSGLVTWLPDPGDTITRGEPVYGVNTEPVTLLYGSLPFYRPLRAGDQGIDVEQLEQNLAKLEYDGFTADAEYTSATADAVARWQADVGLPETGMFDPARVVVASGAIRIAEQLVPLGGPATGQVLSYTGTDQQIGMELEVTDQRLVAEELPVTVTLPDGGTVDGTVTEIGTVAVGGGGDESGGQPETQTTTIEVTVTLDDPDALGDWEAGPVDVTVEVDRREEVLAVPVGALVALAEGGYGVQVVDGDRTSYVPVDTGLFAHGLVEVTGDGIAEGTVVGVPA